MTFFRKTILSNPIATSQGYRIQFQPIGDDEGVIALEDETVIGELKAMATNRVGGVIEITKEEFEELKKKADPASPPKPGLTDPPRWPRPRVGLQGDAVAVEASKEPGPIQPPATEEPVPQKPVDPGTNRPVPKRVINKPSVLS